MTLLLYLSMLITILYFTYVFIFNDIFFGLYKDILSQANILYQIKQNLMHVYFLLKTFNCIVRTCI